MTEIENKNIEIIQHYLFALQDGQAGDELAPFFTEDAMQIELPNQLNPTGQQSDLANIIERSIQGQKILSAQQFKVLTTIAQGDRVAVKAEWTGTLSIPLGDLAAGSDMKAHFAIFFELRDGRIYRQRNYDYFEPC